MHKLNHSKHQREMKIISKLINIIYGKHNFCFKVTKNNRFEDYKFNFNRCVKHANFKKLLFTLFCIFCCVYQSFTAFSNYLLHDYVVNVSFQKPEFIEFPEFSINAESNSKCFQSKRNVEFQRQKSKIVRFLRECWRNVTKDFVCKLRLKQSEDYVNCSDVIDVNIYRRRLTQHFITYSMRDKKKKNKEKTDLFTMTIKMLFT